MRNDEVRDANMDVPDPAGLGAAEGVVLNLAPEIGRWLFGPGASDVAAAVQKAVVLVSGSREPEQQVLALADPAKAGALRVALARIAAERATTAAMDGQAAILAGLARNVGPVDGGAKGGVAYGAPLVSMVVLLTFAVVMVVALTRTMPQGAEPVLNVLLGTLGAMATSVVGYWVGSSAGSARKEERLASLAERT